VYSDLPEFVLHKINRLPVRGLQKSQQNIGVIRKPRVPHRQLRPPSRLQRPRHPQLRPRQSALIKKLRLQQQLVQPSLLQRLLRVSAQHTQRPAQQLQPQVLRHQLHRVNSVWVICLSRRILRQQRILRHQPPLKQRLRVLRPR
jgi:hypothetical protein